MLCVLEYKMSIKMDLKTSTYIRFPISWEWSHNVIEMYINVFLLWNSLFNSLYAPDRPNYFLFKYKKRNLCQEGLFERYVFIHVILGICKFELAWFFRFSDIAYFVMWLYQMILVFTYSYVLTFVDFGWIFVQ